MKRLNRKGFTMLEIIAVVAVLAILLVVLVPRLSGGTDKSKELGTSKELKDFSDAAETMFVESSRLPGVGATAGVDLAAAYNRYIDDYFALDSATLVENTTAPVLHAFKSKAKDPFGEPYGVIFMRDAPATAGITEKILVFSRGKSLTTGRIDYALLMVYTDGKMSKCTVGFKSDIQRILIDVNGNGIKDPTEHLYGYETSGTAITAGADTLMGTPDDVYAATSVGKLSEYLKLMTGNSIVAVDDLETGDITRNFMQRAICIGK